MKMLWQDIKQLFRRKLSFRLACSYLVLLTILVTLLPWLPMPFSPNALDLANTFQPPFALQAKQLQNSFHWLGTDALGRDVLANALYGARTAIFISLPVMLVVSAIGVLLGTLAAFYGNNRLRFSRASAVAIFISIVAFAYYGMYLPSVAAYLGKGYTYMLISLLIFFLVVFIAIKLIRPLLKLIPFFNYKFAFPTDNLLIRLIEFFTSIPKLILILALASFATPSVYTLLVILVLTYWTGTARLARAEMLRVKQLPFYEAAISLGLSNSKLMYKQALPNMLAPLLVSFSFGVAGLMTLESTLSFLGIGVPGTLVSWGRLIAGIKSNTGAWWLVVVPGVFLAATVLALQTFSYHILSLIGKRKGL